MATYITLIHYTQQGIEKIKDSPKRLERAKETVQKAGGQMKAFYLTMGQYDGVSVIEAPSDEVYTSCVLALSSAGAVRTETLRAFTEKEYRKIIAAIP